MTQIRSTWLFGVAAAALLAACGGDDAKKDDAGKEKSSAALERVTTDQVIHLNQVQFADGDPDEAESALQAMKLLESGDGELNFDELDLNGASAVFTDLTSSDDDTNLSIGSVRFDGLDMQGDNPVFSRLVIEDFEVGPPEGSDEEGGLDVDLIQIVNPTPELATYIAALAAGNTDAEMPAFEDIRFDAARMSGIDFYMVDGREEIDFSFDDISVLGFEGERIELMQVTGLALEVLSDDDDGPIDISFESLAFRGVDMDLLGAIVEVAASGGENFEQAFEDGPFDDPMDPGYNAFTVSEFYLAGPGLEVEIPTAADFVTRNRQGAAIRRITPEMSVVIRPDGDADGDMAEFAEGLAMVGYEELELQLESLISYAPDEDEMNIQNFRLSLVDGFDLEFMGIMGGVKEYSEKAKEASLAFDPFAAADMSDEEFEDAMARQEDLMMEAYSALEFQELELRLTDNSIVDRAINLAAAQQDADPEFVRQQAVAASYILPVMLGTEIDPDISADLSSAIASFLQDGGTLSIRFAPDAPMTLADFENFGEMSKDELGLEITTE